MLADNLRLFFPSLESGAPRLAFLLAMSALLTWLNYRGLHVVGGTAVATPGAVRTLRTGRRRFGVSY